MKSEKIPVGFRLLTPVGSSAVQVVRVICDAGSQARLCEAFHLPPSLTGPALVRLSLGEGLFEQAVILPLEIAPDRFQFDFCLHGNRILREKLFLRLIELGFSENPCIPAFQETGNLFDRVLAACPSPRAVRWIAGGLLPGGALCRLFAGLSKNPDDAEVAALKSRAERLKPLALKLIRPPKLVIAGPPNAGKSTLLNELAGRERVLVSPHPGTTRDPVQARVLLSGFALDVTDTAGIRETLEPLEIEAQKRADDRIRSADAVLLLLDKGQPAPNAKLFETLLAGKPCLPILNKSDLEPVCRPEDLPAHLRPVLSLSLKTGDGMDELGQALLRFLFGDEFPNSGDPVWPGEIEEFA